MSSLAPPINIFSGESGLGGALTNPTEMSKRKGCITKSYPIQFGGRHYPDVETAYHLLAEKTQVARTDALMAELIAAKFRQHADLAGDVASRGGAHWLQSCSHWTGARTEGAQAWEGQGDQSRFIRNLVAGYRLFLSSEVIENHQRSLF